MHSYTLLALGLAATLPCVSATAADPVDLTVETFDQYISSYDAVMVEFFAPWCAVCKELEPLYAETASIVATNSSDIRFARVNCVEQNELCETYETPMYPTLRLFQGVERETVYNGPRESADMISFAKVRLRPAIHVLAEGELESFKDSDQVVAVGSWSKNDAASNQTFTRVAEELLDYYRFAATNDKVEGANPSITLYKQYDTRELHFDGDFEDDAIIDFIALNSVPIVGEYSQKWSWYYPPNASVPLVAAFAHSAAERETLANLMRPLAKTNENVMRFVTVDPAREPIFAARLLVSGENKGTTLVMRDTSDRVFHLSESEDLTQQVLSKWIEDFRQGKLMPYEVPDPVPEPDVPEESVVVLEAANFDGVVYDAEYDVLVEFYAPWCGHCKKLIPTYAKLADHFATTGEKVRIAKIDATEHQIPEHSVKSYPTIMFFPAHSKKEAVTYEGNRSLDDFVKFIDANSGLQQAPEDSAPHLDSTSPEQLKGVVRDEL